MTERSRAPNEEQLARLLSAAEQWTVSDQVYDRVRHPQFPDPERGQVWRLAHQRDVSIVVVWKANTSTVSVMPVSEDSEFADPSAVSFESSPLGHPVAVWPSLECVVPKWTLDIWFGTLYSEPLSAARDSFRSQLRTERWPVEEARWSDTSRYRSELAANLEPFVALTWVEESSAEESGEGLAAILQERGHDLRWLGAKLGVADPSTALGLWQGRRILDESQARVLAAELGLPLSHLRQLPLAVPEALWGQLSRPKYRSDVQRWATVSELDERAARDRIAERLLAIAARSSGPAEDRWQELLEQFFSEELDSR